MTLIKFENVSYVYNQGAAFENAALKNINLEIYKGEFVGIIGHTGSGKSTLIQHFNALLKPTSGTVYISGTDINADKSKLKLYRQKIGLVFQYPEHQLFEITVRKDVSYGPIRAGFSKEEINETVIQSLQAVGLGEEFFEKSPFELSGGQKRRVAIAGVLAMKPEVLVLDEPAAGLDPVGREEILGYICNLRKNLGITVILVSHSMEEIGKLVDRAIVISDGEIVMDDTPGTIFSRQEQLEQIGLSVPESTKVMNILKQREIVNFSQVPYTVESAVNEIIKVLSERSNIK